MKQEEINKIIKEHEKWLTTNGNEGQIACLIGEDLHGMDLSYADLHHIFYAMRNNKGE